MSNSNSDPLTVRDCFKIISYLCLCICLLLYYFGVLIVTIILGHVLTVLIVIPLFIFLGCLPSCGIFCCVYVCKQCTICCSDDVPSQETSPVECPPPVQRDEQTAVTIEFEEEGGLAATPLPDKQGELTTGAPPSYQVHIQPRWL